MEARTKSLFSGEILADALERYGIAESETEALDGFESFIFRCKHAGTDRILRISHSSRRSAGAIAAELDWIRFLAGKGVPACRAVASRSGEWLEVLAGGAGSPGESDCGYFTAALFEHAPGGRADDAIWQAPLFETMGRTMGRMHALTRNYRPGDPSFQRPHWHEEITGIAEKFLPADQAVVIDKFNALIAETRELPRSAPTYGLVHFDFHRGNFFVDGDRISLFDFDDCQHTWFADDIAVALFYAVPPDCASPEDLASARTFMRHFLKGYRTESDIAPEWLARVPMFLKRRELDLYIIIHRSLDLNDLGPWTSRFMDGRRSRIENGTPYLDLDFSTV